MYIPAVNHGICTNCYGKGCSTELVVISGAEDFGGDGFPGVVTNLTHYCRCAKGRRLRRASKKLSTV